MTLANVITERTKEDELAELVRRYGGPLSAALLDPDIQLFSEPSIDGVIGYRSSAGCAVSVGDPVCARAQMPRLAEAFRAACKRRRMHTIYAVAGEYFGTWAIEHGYAAMELAHELVIDPTHALLEGHDVKRLRNKVRRASNEGVVAVEVSRARDPLLEQAMQRVVDQWLAARHGPQIYLTHLALFSGRACKRWFYAQRGTEIVGVMQLVRLDAYDGYLISQLLATPDAPVGTTELLAVSALRTLGAEGCGYVTWGPAPLADVVTVKGLGAWSAKVGRAVFRTAARVFKLDARTEYRRKFPIAQSVPCFLLCDPPHVGAREALGVLRAAHAFRIP